MLSRWFWPSKFNHYHPYILRVSGTAVMLGLILLQPLIYNLVSVHRFQLVDYATDVTVSDLLAQTNQERQANGVASLSDNSKLDNAAAAKAADMFAKDYWAHNSPTGQTPWDFISAAGYSYSAAAENLAMDFSTSSGVIAGWMGSPEHRVNMLNPVYSDVGFAVINGTLTGEQTTLVVAEYGAPSAPAPVAAPVKSPPAPTATPAATPVASTPAQTTTQPTTTPAPVQPTATQPAKSTATVQTTRPTGTSKTSSDDVAAPVSMSLVSKFNNVDTLNWGQSVTLFLLFVLLFSNLLKHTVVWRRQKRGWRHIWMRAHPAFQASLLLVAIIGTVASSFGVIK